MTIRDTQRTVQGGGVAGGEEEVVQEEACLCTGAGSTDTPRQSQIRAETGTARGSPLWLCRWGDALVFHVEGGDPAIPMLCLQPGEDPASTAPSAASPSPRTLLLVSSRDSDKCFPPPLCVPGLSQRGTSDEPPAGEGSCDPLVSLHGGAWVSPWLRSDLAQPSSLDVTLTH